MDSKKLLEEFLSFPIDDASDVMQKFASLPSAIYQCGPEKLQQFVYVPGTRRDRVVLVAHADTVWDTVYGNPKVHKLLYKDGVFCSDNNESGIGADDRAGCAMVWALRQSGHSLLILSGEEKGKLGAKYLRDSFPLLYKELNKHCYMIEFDWSGREACLFNQVDNTVSFKKFVKEDMGYRDSQKKGGCDLQILCKRICGVNLSTGWQNCHNKNECLIVSDWDNTYEHMTSFLMRPQRRFAVSRWIPIKRFALRVRGKLDRVVRDLLGKNCS